MSISRNLFEGNLSERNMSKQNFLKTIYDKTSPGVSSMPKVVILLIPLYDI